MISSERMESSWQVLFHKWIWAGPLVISNETEEEKKEESSLTWGYKEAEY